MTRSLQPSGRAPLFPLFDSTREAHVTSSPTAPTENGVLAISTRRRADGLWGAVPTDNREQPSRLSLERRHLLESGARPGLRIPSSFGRNAALCWHHVWTAAQSSIENQTRNSQHSDNINVTKMSSAQHSESEAPSRPRYGSAVCCTAKAITQSGREQPT